MSSGLLFVFDWSGSGKILAPWRRRLLCLLPAILDVELIACNYSNLIIDFVVLIRVGQSQRSSVHVNWRVEVEYARQDTCPTGLG